MCGIHAEFHTQMVNLDDILKRFENVTHRGPDESVTYIDSPQGDDFVFLGFHRLAIVGDIDIKSQKLLNKNDVYLTCNGEIYNYKFLIEKYGLKPNSSSDCAVIIELYLLGLKPEEICNLLDGVFAFVLYDSKKQLVFAARDRIGVRPLFWGLLENESGYVFSSELKGFVNKKGALKKDELDYDKPTLKCSRFDIPEQFPPGHFLFGNLFEDDPGPHKWSPDFCFRHQSDYETAKVIIRELLTRAVQKRLMSERPVGYLLSGGLDSSLIASIGSKLTEGPITTFSIGFENSPDLLAARKVVHHLNRKSRWSYYENGQIKTGVHEKCIHHEIIITEKDVLRALPFVVYATETYDITTIRASIPMYLLAKYIREKTDIKVIMSGEGSDELYGGYLYFHNAPTADAFQKETERLIKDLYKYDVLRSDRSTAAHGLEIRVPFLDIDHSRFVIGLDPMYKMCGENTIEKKILRDAFAIGENGEDYLPRDVLYRRKEAFSDGVGKGSVGALKSYCNEYYEASKGSERDFSRVERSECKNEETNAASTGIMTNEAKFYKLLFERFYGNLKPIDYYWMPKWNDSVTDPSATVLNVYSK